MQSPIVPSRRDGNICAGGNPAEGDRMIFEKLANGVTKHAKLVLILWVVLLCASIYPMMHASEKLSYDISSMGGTSSASVDGAHIMADNFSSMVDTGNAQVLLITYDKNSKIAQAYEELTKEVLEIESREKNRSRNDWVR